MEERGEHEQDVEDEAGGDVKVTDPSGLSGRGPSGSVTSE
jgi:hypothetical protein